MWVVLTKKRKRYGRPPEVEKHEFSNKEDANQYFQSLILLGDLPEIYESQKTK